MDNKNNGKYNNNFNKTKKIEFMNAKNQVSDEIFHLVYRYKQVC